MTTQNEKGAYWAPQKLLPFLCLLLIVLTHASLVFSSQLIPWKGGGFGMFSSLDGKPTRTIIIEGIDAEGAKHRLLFESTTKVNLPEHVRRAYTSLHIMPTEQSFKTLSRYLLTRAVVRCEGPPAPVPISEKLNWACLSETSAEQSTFKFASLTIDIYRFALPEKTAVQFAWKRIASYGEAS